MFSRSVRATSRRLTTAVGAARPTIATVSSTFPSSVRSAVPVTATRSYHDKVIDHYERPRNTGSLPKGDVDVGTGLVGAPACGDVMKLQIRVDPVTQKISDVRFKTFGCGSAIASSSYVTELVKGMTLDEASQVKNTDIAKELCLPPVKLHCSMLAQDAIQSAISNYYSKNPNAKTTDLSGTEKPIPTIAANTA